MSGRGRNINMPAWMTQQQQQVAAPPPSQQHHSPPDEFRRGPPPPMQQSYDDRRDHRGGGGGGYRPHPADRDRDYRDRDYRGPSREYHHHGRDRDRDRSREPPRQSYHHHSRGPPPPSSSRGGPPRPRKPPVVSFRSFEEEMDWVDKRRRMRAERSSKFDVLPGDAAASNPQLQLLQPQVAAGAMLGTIPGALPVDAQQTRHARRLYIGNLPPNVHEQMIHDAFRNAINAALDVPVQDDPILSVYINPERQFSFLEFKTVEMTTACLDLDGLVLQGFAVKIKRPNDYNPMIAPRVHPSSLPRFDVSKLGIIAGSVQDGPNKVFIGGLHYHFQEAQVMELLAAFGKIKAFHLVKNEQDPPNSKGYCFVEYSDSNTTAIAIQGLNGMDIGGGKNLTVRLAGERSGGAGMMATGVNTAGVAPLVAPAVVVPGAPSATHTIVSGFDIEQLVDAALGKVPMPAVPQYRDPMGLPLTRIVPLAQQQHFQQQQQLIPQQQYSQQQPEPYQQQPMHTPNAFDTPSALTRVLVLHNMVLADDLATDQDYAELSQEIRDECAKFGNLTGFMIPRVAGGGVEPTAIRKVYLQYSTVQEAQAAERELKGRQFGDATVDTTYYSESDFAAGKFK